MSPEEASLVVRVAEIIGIQSRMVIIGILAVPAGTAAAYLGIKWHQFKVRLKYDDKMEEFETQVIRDDTPQ